MNPYAGAAILRALDEFVGHGVAVAMRRFFSLSSTSARLKCLAVMSVKSATPSVSKKIS